MSNQDTPTDPRAAAEEALRLHAFVTTEEDRGTWPIGTVSAYIEAKERLEKSAYTLLPILARAVIEGLEDLASLQATLADTLGRDAIANQERDAARAELASLRAREPLTEAEAQALAEHIEFFRARVSGSTKRAIMGWFTSRRTTTTGGE